MHSWFRKREEEEEEEKRKVIFPSLVIDDRLLGIRFKWIFSMLFIVYRQSRILVFDGMMISPIDWITNTLSVYWSSSPSSWPANNFPMIKFNGNASFPLSLSLPRKSFSPSSWVPAIFTRNYEIYVSNYCWIHNVSEGQRKFFERWEIIRLDVSYQYQWTQHATSTGEAIYSAVLSICPVYSTPASVVLRPAASILALG